jgi:hypothetical protein
MNQLQDKMYEEKYLKYKEKYLELKNQIGSGPHEEKNKELFMLIKSGEFGKVIMKCKLRDDLYKINEPCLEVGSPDYGQTLLVVALKMFLDYYHDSLSKGFPNGIRNLLDNNAKPNIFQDVEKSPLYLVSLLLFYHPEPEYEYIFQKIFGLTSDENKSKVYKKIFNRYINNDSIVKRMFSESINSAHSVPSYAQSVSVSASASAHSSRYATSSARSQPSLVPKMVEMQSILRNIIVGTTEGGSNTHDVATKIVEIQEIINRILSNSSEKKNIQNIKTELLHLINYFRPDSLVCTRKNVRDGNLVFILDKSTKIEYTCEKFRQLLQMFIESLESL